MRVWLFLLFSVSLCIASLHFEEIDIHEISSLLKEEIPPFIHESSTTRRDVVPQGDGGIFGEWNSDGPLPYFQFTMDELTNPQASWPNSEQIPPMNVTRTDHFYLFGNQQINVKGVDDGYVELFNTNRGPTWINYYEPSYNNLAGGFSYATWDNQEPFCTAYKYGPQSSNAEWNREFHVGYYNTTLSYENVKIVCFPQCLFKIFLGFKFNNNI